MRPASRNRSVITGRFGVRSGRCGLGFADRQEVGRPVDSISAGSLPTQRRAILFPSERFSLAQPHRLEGLSTLDSVRQSSAHLGHESLLILRISQTLGRKLCGSKIEVGAGELRVLPDGILHSNSLIPNHLRRRGALLEEFALLDHPAVAVSLDFLVV